MERISWQEFDAVEMRVGKIISVEEFPEARNPSYLVSVDFGKNTGVKKSSVAIRNLYQSEELMGRLIVAVTNFPPKQIATHRSEVLILAAVNADGTMKLLQPDGDVELGARIG